MIDMGLITHNTILGLKVTYNCAQGFIQIFQQRYVQSILFKLKMESRHLVSTPLEPNTKLNKTNCPTTPQEKEKMQHVPYKTIVQSFMYLSIYTQPNISYCTSIVV
jgi:hypothetical protein